MFFREGKLLEGDLVTKRKWETGTNVIPRKIHISQDEGLLQDEGGEGLELFKRQYVTSLFVNMIFILV